MTGQSWPAPPEPNLPPAPTPKPAGHGQVGRQLRTEHALLQLDAVTEGVDPITKEAVVRIPAVVTMEGVMNGSYKPASEVENPLFWRFFDGLPYVPDHPSDETVVVTAASEVAGYSDRPRLRHKGKRPFIATRLNIYRDRDRGKQALHRIFDLGMDEVSIGFWTSPQRMEGDYFDPALDENVSYVQVDTDMKPDHTATVDKGACSGGMGCGLKREAKLNVPGRVSTVPMGQSEDGRTGERSGYASWMNTAGSGALPSGLPGAIVKIPSPPFLESEGAIAPHGGTRAPDDTPWSFSGADGDALISRGGFSAFKDAHAWVEGTGTPEQKNKYKLPHHKVVAGSVKLVFRGVAAAAVVIGGGRGGLNVPPGDVPGIKRHVSAHYRQFDRDPPFDAEGNLAREWVYPEEAEALVTLLEVGEADLEHPWLDAEVRPSSRASVWDRLKAWARLGAAVATHHDNDAREGVKPQGDGDMCEAHEALEKERDDLKAQLDEALAELATLVEERDEREREALLSRLEAATGLEGEKLTDALQEAGIDPADLEALELAAGSVEIAVPREKAKAVGSLGATGDGNIEEDLHTVGVRGVHYALEDGRVVGLPKEE